jgi:hypothetical protein
MSPCVLRAAFFPIGFTRAMKHENGASLVASKEVEAPIFGEIEVLFVSA